MMFTICSLNFSLFHFFCILWTFLCLNLFFKKVFLLNMIFSFQSTFALILEIKMKTFAKENFRKTNKQCRTDIIHTIFYLKLSLLYETVGSYLKTTERVLIKIPSPYCIMKWGKLRHENFPSQSTLDSLRFSAWLKIDPQAKNFQTGFYICY